MLHMDCNLLLCIQSYMELFGSKFKNRTNSLFFHSFYLWHIVSGLPAKPHPHILLYAHQKTSVYIDTGKTMMSMLPNIISDTDYLIWQSSQNWSRLFDWIPTSTLSFFISKDRLSWADESFLFINRFFKEVFWALSRIVVFYYRAGVEIHTRSHILDIKEFILQKINNTIVLHHWCTTT